MITELISAINAV